MSSRLNWIYARSPVWLQNLGISLYGLSYRQERLGGDFEKYVDGFRSRENWSAEHLSAYVEAQVRAVLIKAYDEVPYYRKRWTDLKIGYSELAHLRLSELQRLPLTPKSDLRKDPHAFVVTSAKSRELRRYDTSGSTGTPIATYCSTGDHRRFVAAREVRSFGWAGVSIRMSRAMIGGRMVVPRHDSPPPYYRRNWAEKQVYFSAFHISRTHAANYVEGFNRYQPEFSTGYAHSHYMLARCMETEGLQLGYRPRAFVLGSEKLTADMKETIVRSFGVRAYEEYGSVENCVLATECEYGRLHVSPDVGFVEIVDDAGQPVPRGQVGRLVCTGLVNLTQLLIRYEIGDVAAWSAESCPCGRDQLPVLHQLIGRLEEVIVGRDGCGVMRFHSAFLDLPGVVEGQVIQESLDLIRVRVVGNDAFGDYDVRELKRRIANERLGDLEVVIERVPAIERTTRGKFQAVVNRLPREVVERALRGHREPALPLKSIESQTVR